MRMAMALAASSLPQVSSARKIIAPNKAASRADTSGSARATQVNPVDHPAEKPGLHNRKNACCEPQPNGES